MSAPTGLAFKAYEIEELVDIYFFRRLGILVARAARALRLSPNSISIVSGLVGMTGGALLVDDRVATVGVGLMILHGVFDSADGQLARLTGQTSELGRLLDGAGGYVTHAAAYLAIAIRIVSQEGSWWPLGVAVLAGIATAIHAQMYDYHRTAYAAIVIKGRIDTEAGTGAAAEKSALAVIRIYNRLQRALAGGHPRVEAAIAARASDGVVRDEDRRRYRICFYRPVRGWNLFGDNVRRLGFIVLVRLHHLEWYFAFILIPLNVLLACVWVWQWRADRRFLALGRSVAPVPPG